MYWVTRDSGDLFRQDKFGRGVPEKVKGDLANPTSVRVLQPYRYNTSVVSGTLSSNFTAAQLTNSDGTPPGLQKALANSLRSLQGCIQLVKFDGLS